MKVVIFANGEQSDLSILKRIISEADYIIAADGGIFNCITNDIQADCIIGDFDSLKTKDIQSNTKAKLIHIEEQQSTDLEKALKHARELNPSQVDIFCAFGKRQDHSLGNIFILNNNNDLYIKMHDAHGTLFGLNPGKSEFNNMKGTTLSLFAVEQVKSIELSGFKFPLKREHIGPSFIGVSNEISANYATIKFEKGRLLVYQIRDERNK